MINFRKIKPGFYIATDERFCYGYLRLSFAEGMAQHGATVTQPYWQALSLDGGDVGPSSRMFVSFQEARYNLGRHICDKYK